MKTVIVIQARLGSSRLPCKTLLNLRGLPVIDWVVERCGRSELADDLVVALPDTRRDEVLARHLQARGVNIFRGSEQDVLSRMRTARPPRTGPIWSCGSAPTTHPHLGRRNRQPHPLLPARKRGGKLRLRLQPHPPQQPLS